MGRRRESGFSLRERRSRRPKAALILFIALAVAATGVSYIFWQKNKELIAQYEQEDAGGGAEALQSFIAGLDEAVETAIGEGKAIPYGGGLYSQQEAKWLDLGDFTTEETAYEAPALFYTDQVLFGHLAEDGYLVTGADGTEDSFGSLEEAKESLRTTYGETFGTGELLVRGNEDRAAIAEVIRTEEKAQMLVYIRYLASDGEDAFLISSPGENTQQVDQYYFRKQDGQWTILAKADKEQGYELLNSLGVDDFSLGLLPGYRVKDYEILDHSSAEIYTFMSYLRSQGAAQSQDGFYYFSHVDNYVLALPTSGGRVLLKTAEGNPMEVEGHQVLDPNENYASFHNLIDEDYDGEQAPYFLFLQN